jgi:serine beta-lactamase-like protein LACTB, mitochondrial
MVKTSSRRRSGFGAARRRSLIALRVALLIVSGAGAQSSQLPPDLHTKIESAVSSFMAETKAPGLSVAVVREGEFAWAAGFGMADLENSVPATAQTVYRLASISKTLTATAALALWEAGKLDLDVPVQKYCPAFPEKPWPITVRQLLGNLGGIRSYRVPEFPYWISQADPEVGNTRHFENGIAAGLKFFADDPLVAQPGTHFNYSTHGYTLAGCAMEGAVGERYADCVRKRVLDPAGMRQTRPDDRVAIVPLRTRYYSKDQSGSLMNAEFLDASYKVPGGGWLSSAPDMARFMVAILSDRLVKRSTRDLMWTAVMPKDGRGRLAYGLGWQLGQTHGVNLVGHGGSQQGTSTMMLMAPEKQAGVVVLGNSDSHGASGLAIRLLRLVLELPPYEDEEVAVDPKAFAGYLGTYELGDFKMTIVRDGDRLAAEIRGQKLPLVARSAREYAFKAFDGQIVFAAGNGEHAKELTLREGGIDSYLNRID